MLNGRRNPENKKWVYVINLILFFIFIFNRVITVFILEIIPLYTTWSEAPDVLLFEVYYRNVIYAEYPCSQKILNEHPYQTSSIWNCY